MKNTQQGNKRRKKKGPEVQTKDDTRKCRMHNEEP